MRRRVFDCLMQYIFPPKIEFVFAFYHRNKLVIPAECDGWNLYNPVEEFSRLGIPNVQFRLSSANSNFSLCSTYPAILAVPNCISDADLVKIANFRSRGRLPVLSWKSENNVCLFRCAQPNVGINSSRCSEDEFLLYSISQLTREGSIVYIYDARYIGFVRINLHIGQNLMLLAIKLLVKDTNQHHIIKIVFTFLDYFS